MTYLPGLLVALAAFWFALSGQTSPFFLVLAVVAVLLTLWLSARLQIIGRDASPYHRVPHMLLYAVWLLGEIVKSNIAVIARVLGPRHAIDPAMVQVQNEGAHRARQGAVRQFDHADARARSRSMSMATS